ncbi:MAG: type II toxin-antitoxin system RelE/ParE family toxin [Planctomycetes bacterium]|nr:type II toxin-antitoxin system RelE/ParE family toxin [Planctomycetota bacterium]
MKVRHGARDLERLESDPKFTGDYAQNIVQAFRRRMQLIRNAASEQDLRAMKSLHFEKLKGARSRQHSIRLNDQWRLILEFEGEAPSKVVVVVKIEDYH